VTSPFPSYTPHVPAKPKTLSRQKWKVSVLVKIVAAGACERLMPIYQIMKHYIAEDYNIKNN
jgi:hypothetical protein